MRTIRLPMMFLAVWLPGTHGHGAVTCVSSDSVYIFVSISFFLLLPISTFLYVMFVFPDTRLLAMRLTAMKCRGAAR